MVRVLLVDDHSMFREGVERLLAADPLLQVTASVGTLEQAVEQVQGGRFDVAVVDLHLPDGNGLRVVERLHGAAPRLPLLVLTSRSEQQIGVRCLRVGASGFLNKREVGTVLREALVRVAAGRRYIGPELADMLASSVTDDGPEKPHDKLSDREFEVMEALVAGQSPSEIAVHLHLSIKTVSTYKARIQEKLGLRGTADIVRYALTEGLFD